MAHDRARKLAKLKYVMQTSMLKTLAAKHKTSVDVVAKKHRVEAFDAASDEMHIAYRVKVERPGKYPMSATFGGFSLRRQDKEINDQPTRNRNGRTEILERLTADQCENCGSEKGCQAHHVKKVSGLVKWKDRPDWADLMVIRSRKTLVLCRKCHTDLHAGRYVQCK